MNQIVTHASRQIQHATSAKAPSPIILHRFDGTARALSGDPIGLELCDRYPMQIWN